MGFDSSFSWVAVKELKLSYHNGYIKQTIRVPPIQLNFKYIPIIIIIIVITTVIIIVIIMVTI